MADGLAQPLDLARRLIHCASVTPADEGALDVLQTALESLGFKCTRLPFSEPGADDVDNLYARLGTDQPNFCFAGHTDVVPVGAPKGWSVDPFGAEIIDGVLYGRGASDMKAAIAAFVAAVARFLDEHGNDFGGSISLLITGDEEGVGINGTRKMMDWLKDNGETLTHCLVGEPTNPTQLGEMVKVGRRGSLVGYLTVYGTQGHTAYPDLADNPIDRLMRMLAAVVEEPLDDGTDHFQPSSVAISTIDVGNPATNVIPAEARATFNIRFNDRHSQASLKTRLTEIFDGIGGDYQFRAQDNGEAFLCEPDRLAEIIADAAEKVTGRRPELSTTGGTSDARYIHKACTCAEFGLVGQTMHKADESQAVADIEALADIYTGVLDAYFAGA
ncbi:MAG: succinyl-diaminopimelate desuccinylase [Alphaproteobacteria bacterium]|nr:succinyl-diaminopimelate desuccinylase [Alphaproteobacteria bacterium]